MKVLMLSHYFSSHKGGVGAVADVRTHAFADAGHKVVWMAGDASQEPEADGRVRCVPFAINNFAEIRTGVPFPIPLLRGIKAILREVQRADVLLKEQICAGAYDRAELSLMNCVGNRPHGVVLPYNQQKQGSMDTYHRQLLP